MSNPVKAQPDQYHSVTPYLTVKGGAAAIDFYKKAFGATEIFRMPQPDGRVGHAEIKIGDSTIMMSDEFPEMGVVSPTTLGNTTAGLLVYVADADKTFNNAVSLGAKVNKPMADQFYGDRSGTVVDPFGHKWTIATHKEDVAPEEMEKRIAALSKK
jgi:PhnB protein